MAAFTGIRSDIMGVIEQTTARKKAA